MTLDVGLSMSSIFFKLQITNDQQKLEEKYYKIEHKDGTSIDWEMAEMITDPLFNFSMAEVDDAKGFVSLFKTPVIIQAHRTALAVAHRNFISLYNLQKNKWVKHVYFPADVKWFY
mmetsp:Transcript_19002/g.13804  ORF Transcript_19002/g.13804 Transcript_19002/m.13804 type:complete len:116 (+) Transcript_19002:959-1306(+)